MIYVDSLFYWPKSKTHARNSGMWCHMWADTQYELNAFAQAIGLRPEWMQAGGLVAHYDLTPGKRNFALSQGAIEKDMRTWLRETAKTRGGTDVKMHVR